MDEPIDLKRLISASRLRLSRLSPFFSTLALHAPFHVSERVPTAATDGQAVYVNPGFFANLTPEARDGLLLHEVLHAALLHVTRRGLRDPQLWNIAADIVVNGILVRNGFTIPDGGLRDVGLERLSVEEVYEHVAKEAKKRNASAASDLLDAPPADAHGGGQSGGKPGQAPAHQEGQWRNALRAASEASEAAGQGSAPAGLEREVESVREPQLDWRSYLWRYLTRTPVDFEEFDRRFIGRGLYLETISGQSVQVLVALDTSASIQRKLLGQFLGEVNGILQAYPGLRCDLFYADAALDGPHALSSALPEAPHVRGGGGTDFRPFFAVAEHDYGDWPHKVAVYLTDGFGTFPPEAPSFPTLWVVTPGGRKLDLFPFGEVVRLTG